MDLNRRLTVQERIQASPDHCSPRTIINSVLAGYAAGISGTLVGHPLDSAKVWLQTQTNAAANPATEASQAAASAISNQGGKALYRASAAAAATPAVSTSTTSSLSRAFSTLAVPAAPSLSHVKRLYNGISGPLVTVGLVQSMNFAVYDSVRRTLHSLDTQQEIATTSTHTSHYLNHDRLLNVWLSAVTAGSVLATMTSPMLIVKTQQQVHNLSFRQALHAFRGANDSAFSISRMYIGFAPHFFAETMGRGLYFVTYEGLKRYWTQQVQGREHPTMTTRMVCAGLSGIACWALIFPFDALRCRLYAQANHSQQQEVIERLSARQMARKLYQKSGLGRFYRGFTVTVLRAGPVAAAVLPIYDFTLDQLNRHAD